MLAERLEYVGSEQVQSLLRQVIAVGKLLNGLINSLKK